MSNIGTWMEAVALGILVTKTTGRSEWTAIVAGAAFLPGVVLNPLGGALADRYSRRAILMISNGLLAAAAGLLAYLASRGTPAPSTIALIALFSGCVNALGFPAYQTLLPDLVPAGEVVKAVGLSSAQWNLGRVVGPAVAAAVIGEDRYALAFTLNALSFAGPFVVASQLALPRLARAGDRVVAAMAAGFRFVLAEPGLRALFVYMTISSLFAAPFIALIPPMALHELEAGSRGVSALITAQGLGAVVMALSLGALVKRFSGRTVLVSVLWLLPFALVAYYSAPGIVAAVAIMLLVGALYLGALSSFTSMAQLRAPAELRGRILAVYSALLSGMYPLGSVIQGRIADRVGLRVTAGGAAVAMISVLVALSALRPRFSHALSGGSEPQS